jgi:hypothetical protein
MRRVELRCLRAAVALGWFLGLEDQFNACCGNRGALRCAGWLCFKFIGNCAGLRFASDVPTVHLRSTRPGGSERVPTRSVPPSSERQSAFDPIGHGGYVVRNDFTVSR